MSFTIETQTENREIISLCHINEKMLSLENSLIAQKVFKSNRALFERLNKNTKIIGGTIYRQQIIDSLGSTNKVYVEVGNKQKFKEEEIAKLTFDANNRLRNQIRAVNKYGVKFDYEPDLVSEQNTGGYVDLYNLSPSDIKSSTMVASVRELELFQHLGIKTIMLTDNLQNKRSLQEVSYRIQVIIQTEFRDFIKYVIKQSEKSLLFLESYLDSLSHGENYNEKTLSFNKDYTSRVMSSLGLSTDLGTVNLNSNRIKSSNFGRAAIAYYNLASLLSNSVGKQIYSKIISTILPTNKTTPEAINNFIRNFNSILANVKSHYLQEKKQDNQGIKPSRVDRGSVITNIVEAISKEKLEVDQENLGYLVFSSHPGLNFMSSAEYKNRWAQEQQKYYPNIKADDQTNFMTEEEKQNFSDTTNYSDFVTPTTLVHGDTHIQTNRGMQNMSIDSVRGFRLAKSARHAQQQSEKGLYVAPQHNLSNELAGLNVVISEPRTALLDRSFEQDIDPYVDAKNYVGGEVSFTTYNPKNLMAEMARATTDADKQILNIAADIIPQRFLRNNRAINSIKEIQLSNSQSITRKLIAEGNINLNDLPPQVKYMATNDFNPNPSTDPIQNSESREIIQETQKNLFLILFLRGFMQNEQGFLDVHTPIYSQPSAAPMFEMEQTAVLGKAIDFEVPELGIVKDNFLATIYNNLVYIRKD